MDSIILENFEEVGNLSAGGKISDCRPDLAHSVEKAANTVPDFQKSIACNLIVSDPLIVSFAHNQFCSTSVTLW